MSSEETRKCPACEQQVAVANDRCSCGYPRLDFQACAVCKLPMPEKADRCNACSSYQGGIRRYFGLSATVLSLIIALISVIGAVLPGIAAYRNHHSNTIVTFIGATNEAISIRVRNTGLSPSILRGYRLHFGSLPVEEAQLALARKDAPETLDFVPAGGEVTIPLTVPGLRSRVPHAELAKKIAMQQVILEVEVQESDSPRNGPWSRRTVAFPAHSIREFILAIVPQEQRQ